MYEVGSIFIYNGNNSEIRGELVEIIKGTSKMGHPMIRLVGNIYYNEGGWGCSPKYLEPYKSKPDWEV